MLSFAIWLGGFLGSLFFQESPKRPNVLLILTDDQGYGDVAVHENGMVETPVLDNFAKTAAQFEHFYVSPLCAPTRASLLTGRYHLRTGTVSVSKGLEIMRAQEVTLKIDYTCPADQVGSKVRLSIENQILIAKITTAFDPEMIPNPDRIKRKEVYQKNWKTLILGKVTIPKGISKIVLTAPKVAKNQVAELKSISLVRSGR